MNEILKYIIFFLLGIVVYYFLFTNPSVGSRKVIEGFSNGLIQNTEVIFLKSRLKITGDGDNLTAAPNDPLPPTAITYLNQIPSSLFASDVTEDQVTARSPLSADILVGQDAIAFDDNLLTIDLKESKFINSTILSENLSGAEGRAAGINTGTINYQSIDSEAGFLEFISSVSGLLVQAPFKIEPPSGDITLAYEYFLESSTDDSSPTPTPTLIPYNPLDDLAELSTIFTTPAKTSLSIPSDITLDNSLIYKNTADPVTNYLIIYNPEQALSEGDNPTERSSLFSSNLKILFATNQGDAFDADFNLNHNYANPGSTGKRAGFNSANAYRLSPDANAYKIFKYDLSGLEELSNENTAGENQSVEIQIPRTLRVPTANAKSLKINVLIPYTDIFKIGTFLTFDPDNKIQVKTSAEAADSTGIHYLNYVSKFRQLEETITTASITEAEDIKNSLILLADIMGTDDTGSFGGGAIGCNQTVCERANTRLDLDPHTRVHYVQRETTATGNFNNCSPAEKGSPEFEASERPACTPEMCCYDSSCLSNFFAKGGNCGDRQILGSADCDDESGGQQCADRCCGDSISGVIRKMFYSIKRFGSTIVRTGPNSTPNAKKIFLKDIVFYIYYHTLDLYSMLETGITDPNSGNIPQMFDDTPEMNPIVPDDGSASTVHTEDNYMKLRDYFESAFDQNQRGGGFVNTDTHNTVIESMKLRGEVSGRFQDDNSIFTNNEKISQFINRLSGYTEYGGGGKTLESITGNFQNYLTFYDGYESPGDDGTVVATDNSANLILDLKNAIARLTVNSPSLKDGQGNQISKPISLLILGTTDPDDTQISLSEFQLFL